MLSVLAAACLTMSPTSRQPADDLLTIAESSGYTRTSRYAEVIDLIGRIDERSAILRRGVLGATVEGREIPLVIIANPPIENAEQAKASGKLVFFAFANIHAGEVEGKESLMMLARELALDADHPLLKDLVFVFAPIYNADGNERFGPNDQNRPGQVGPQEMGVRPNAQGLDLNRDYVKLEAPETRGLVRFFTEWDPHITIDCHTTNGSHHRYTLTYDAPTNPSGATEPIEFVRDTMLPVITTRLLARTGYDTFFYGDFNRDHTAWTTYSAQPRFGAPYQGLRGQMQVLSEAYSYAPFKDRVLCTLEFVREIATYAAENRAKIVEIHERARAQTVARGENPQPSDTVGLRHKFAAAPELVIAKGWEYETPTEPQPEGSRRRGVRLIPTDTPKDYPVVHLGRFEPTLSVPRPLAYIIPPGFDDIVENLRLHGVVVEPFNGMANVEVATVDSIQSAQQPFQGHTIRLLEVTTSTANRDVAGGFIVRTAQPLGNLIVYLLEPQSEDGLAAWDLFGDRIKQGGEYPVLRVRSRHDLPH